MGDINPIPNTITASVGSFVDRSPCRVCPYWKTGPGPTICINWDVCPLRILREPVSCYTPQESRNGPNKPMKNGAVKGPCPFEGCKVKTQFEVCWQHRKTFERRKARGLIGGALYKSGRLEAEK